MRISIEGRDALVKVAKPAKRARKTVQERLMAKLDVRGPNECWPWTGAISGGSNGYGSIHVNGETTYIHRLSHELFKGPIPKGKLALHTCDCANCGNPDHIYAGTHQDNVNDMIERKRARSGGRKGILTAKQVKKIVSLAKSGMKRSAIGSLIGCSGMTVARILQGRTYTHITGLKLVKDRVPAARKAPAQTEIRI